MSIKNYTLVFRIITNIKVLYFILSTQIDIVVKPRGGTADGKKRVAHNLSAVVYFVFGMNTCRYLKMYRVYNTYG